MFVSVMGIHWAVTIVSFIFIYEPYTRVNAEKKDPSAFLWRVVFAVCLGLLGPVDLTCYLVTSTGALDQLFKKQRTKGLIANEIDLQHLPDLCFHIESKNSGVNGACESGLRLDKPISPTSKEPRPAVCYVSTCKGSGRAYCILTHPFPTDR